MWNQLAALERLAQGDAVVAFIDAGALPTPLWLPRTIDWAGIRHRVNGPQDVIVERREEAW